MVPALVTSRALEEAMERSRDDGSETAFCLALRNGSLMSWLLENADGLQTK